LRRSLEVAIGWRSLVGSSGDINMPMDPNPHYTARKVIPHQYDSFRPIPPRQIYTSLLSITKKNKPRLVVDLGCGTGNSTRPWAQFAQQVVGIDVSTEMVEYAKHKTKAGNVSYLVGCSSSTGLLDQNVDIVTCSSSIHWMEPMSTFREIVRIVKPGGVFAAYGPQIPPLPLHAWEVGAAFSKFIAFAKQMDLTQPEQAVAWKWAEILQYAKTQNFSYVDELCFNSIVRWDAFHFCEWLCTISYVNRLVKLGHSDVIREFNKLKSNINTSFAKSKQMLLFSYRLILCIK
jgi:ubiquinone/menaquinone biosynthesis C-methylase UbiE